MIPMTTKNGNGKASTKPPPVRTVRLEAVLILVLTMTIGTDVHRYKLARLPSDIGGKAYRLTKTDGTSYDVLLSGKGEHTCTCPGHTYRERCKHVSALVALAATGKLASFGVG